MEEDVRRNPRGTVADITKWVLRKEKTRSAPLNQPKIAQCFEGIHAGMPFAETVDIDLFRIAVLHESMTGSIE